MRVRHWSWTSACALFLVTACTGPTESASQTVTSASAAVTSAVITPVSTGAHRAHHSRKDASARLHPTGRRELDASDPIRAADGAQKVIGVQPTQLRLNRLRDENPARFGKTSSQSNPKLAALSAAVVPFGADLITGDPASDESSAPSAPETIPRSVDNSLLPAFPEIRDQGGLNTCVPFAVGYYQYTYSVGLLAGWDNKNSTDTNKISPKWLYNLVNGGNDNGTSPYSVHAILKEHGALTWSEFPYVGDVSDPLNYREWPRTAEAWESAMKYKSLGFAWVATPSTPEALAAMKSMLANGQVLTFDTYIYSWEFQQLADDPSTSADDAFVGQQIATWMNGYDGTHEATIVGYNDDVWVDINANGAVDLGEKGAFKIANSWGPYWQNAGFAWVAYDAVQWQSQVPDGPAEDARAGIMGQVWALVGARADYQPNLLAEFSATSAARGNLNISVGLTEPDRNDVIARYEPPAFRSSGGQFAYDGSTTDVAQSGSFALDLSDLALSYGDLKYVLRADNNAQSEASLSGFTLVDRLRSNRRTPTGDPPQSMAQHESKAQSVRYKYRDSAHVPHLTLSPSTWVPFGRLTLGQSAKRTITAKNTGTGDLMVTSLRFDNPLFRARTPGSFRLAPGASSTIELEFAPAASQCEHALLTVHDTSANSARSLLVLSGSATSADDDARYQLFISEQNGPYDDSVAMRAELKSRVPTSTLLSDYQVVYYLNDPGFDPTTVHWDAQYSNVGPITASVKQIFLTRQLGVRRATWSVTFRFAPGTTLPAGASAIFQGSLRRADHSWYPDETDDWSRYLRYDGMAEGAVIQAIATQDVVFGLPAEGAPGAYQLAFSPAEVTTQTVGTASFTVNDPTQVGTQFVLSIDSSQGEAQQTWWVYPDALGVRTVDLPLVDKARSPLKPGNYVVILETGGVRVDATQFSIR